MHPRNPVPYERFASVPSRSKTDEGVGHDRKIVWPDFRSGYKLAETASPFHRNEVHFKFMTEEQRKLCLDLVMHPNGVRRISEEDFLRQFPSAVENGRLALEWLEEASQAQSARDLGCALIVGFTFGFVPEHGDILCRLVEAEWHHSHEDVVSALDEMKPPNAAEALFCATEWTPKYLEFDENRALASKAIWALGKLADNEADTKLTLLANSEDALLRKAATQQLERRRRLAGFVH